MSSECVIRPWENFFPWGILLGRKWLVFLPLSCGPVELMSSGTFLPSSILPWCIAKRPERRSVFSCAFKALAWTLEPGQEGLAPAVGRWIVGELDGGHFVYDNHSRVVTVDMVQEQFCTWSWKRLSMLAVILQSFLFCSNRIASRRQVWDE